MSSRFDADGGIALALTRLMEWTDANLANVDEAARRLLSRLRLAQYWFTVVPHWQKCGVRIQYAGLNGWQQATFYEDAHELIASQHDADVRNALLSKWAKRFGQSRGDEPERSHTNG